jgi:O-6-methylguanine DNA methyltransferase
MSYGLEHPKIQIPASLERLRDKSVSGGNEISKHMARCGNQIQGTEFQREVYNLVRQIPVGAVASYTDIAAKLDMPRAGRSVGAAIGKNPLLIFIPDHRVIIQGGSVGGFAGKWNRKPGLLDLEKRLAAKNESV